MYGANFQLCPEQGYFSAKWRTWRWRRGVHRVTALKAPPYLLPKKLYPRLAWSRQLRGWGGSESSVALKAFFTDTPILNVGGPLARHWFRKDFHYQTDWSEVWRNHAIIARTCFDAAAWDRYWRPRVFDRHLSESPCQEVESAALEDERRHYADSKIKADRQFWSDLLGIPAPC
jgi:hypothetical protein